MFNVYDMTSHINKDKSRRVRAGSQELHRMKTCIYNTVYYDIFIQIFVLYIP